MKKNLREKINLNSRRNFIRNGRLFIYSTAVIGTAGIIGACSTPENKTEEEEGDEGDEEEMVSANEDLMREHGLLQRMMLIYDTAVTHEQNNEDFDYSLVHQTADIVQQFVEDYHEKLEETYLFPRFKKANRLVDLVDTLISQHAGGRVITGKILEITGNGKLTDNDDKKNLANLMMSFNRMYRPHEAREDTILFPEFKEIVSRNEYDALGEDFEKKEHEKFGGDGFNMMVEKVAALEKKAGTFDLDQFTPQV